MTKYQRIVFDGIERRNIIQEITIAILSVLHREKWKLLRNVLDEAGIKPDNPLIFTAIVKLKRLGLIEVCGSIENNQDFDTIIKLTPRGVYYIQDHLKKTKEYK